MNKEESNIVESSESSCCVVGRSSANEMKSKTMMSAFKEIYYWKADNALQLFKLRKQGLFDVYLHEIEELEKLDERIGVCIEFIKSFATIGVNLTMSALNGK